MTHCSDDELVLHYYGESPDAGEHIAACAGCRAVAARVDAGDSEAPLLELGNLIFH